MKTTANKFAVNVRGTIYYWSTEAEKEEIRTEMMWAGVQRAPVLDGNTLQPSGEILVERHVAARPF